MATHGFSKSNAYDQTVVREKIMGPNPLKLLEELLQDHAIPCDGTVMDLGSGQGITSVMLARDYGFRVFACDLWSDPTDNLRFFERMGLSTDRVVPLKTDAANGLPFAHEFFDAVVSIDSYHYFACDPAFLDEKLLPFVKPGGFVYIAVPGMKDDGLHEDLPAELLLSWTPEELSALHDAAYWQALVNQAQDADVVSVHEMDVNEEAWNDWLACDNEYSVNDRASLDAGAGAYLNFVAIVLRCPIRNSTTTVAGLPSQRSLAFPRASSSTRPAPLVPAFRTCINRPETNAFRSACRNQAGS